MDISAPHAAPAPDAGEQAQLARDAYDLALGFRELHGHDLHDRYERWLSAAARLGHPQACAELAGLRAARNALIAAVNTIDTVDVLTDHLLDRDPQP